MRKITRDTHRNGSKLLYLKASYDCDFLPSTAGWPSRHVGTVGLNFLLTRKPLLGPPRLREAASAGRREN